MTEKVERYTIYLVIVGRIERWNNIFMVYGKVYVREESIELSKGLQIGTLDKIEKLFDELDWEIEDLQDNEFSLFDRFCSMIAFLEENEQNLLLRITKDFLKVDFDDYLKYLIKVLKEIADNNTLLDIKEVIVLPLVPEKDLLKIKSSSLMAYLFQSPELKYDARFTKIKFNVTHSLITKETKKSGEVVYKIDRKKILSINDSPKKIVFLVDDFIGTGETAVEAIDYYTKTLGIHSNKIKVVSLITQKGGIEEVEKTGVEIFSAIVRNKAISDFYTEKELAEYLEILGHIGGKLEANEDSLYGYKNSEALVSMIRTPNNTLPIYWLEKKKYKHKAPFPR